MLQFVLDPFQLGERADLIFGRLNRYASFVKHFIPGGNCACVGFVIMDSGIVVLPRPSNQRARQCTLDRRNCKRCCGGRFDTFIKASVVSVKLVEV